MPIPTPFHPRTSALCQSHEWRTWSGYLAPSLYEMHHEREYYAIRSAAALIDVSPLFKYEITGPEALQMVNRIVTRDVHACTVGQVMYTPWCDDDGKVIDDGTIQRLDENRFRITAADPNLRWFQDCGYGMEAEVIDVSEKLAALALQGPNSRAILQPLVQEADIENLGYFRITEGSIAGFPLSITRTGYTGDLGYELWFEKEHALPLWDVLMENGKGYGITPVGIVALDIARIEAGLLLIEVDYISSQRALIDAQKSSPFEIGLGWAVQWNPGNNFVGRKALEAEKSRGPGWKFVGLEVDWGSIEKIFGAVDLPPQITGRASREPVPVYSGGKQIGQVTSSTFSPILKQFIAIGTLFRPYAQPGRVVQVEVTVEYSRELAQAKVVKTPFYEPAWKKA